MFDKFMLSARNMSVAMIIVAVSSTYFAAGDMRDMRDFREARSLVAQWLFYDMLYDDFKFWIGFRGDATKFVPISHFSKYYECFGNVTLSGGMKGYVVDISVPPAVGRRDPKYVGEPIYGSRPWTAIAGTGADADSEIFGPFSNGYLEYWANAPYKVAELNQSNGGMEMQWTDFVPPLQKISYERNTIEIKLGSLLPNLHKVVTPQFCTTLLVAYRDMELDFFNKRYDVPYLGLGMNKGLTYLALMVLQLIFLVLASDSVMGMQRTYQKGRKRELWLVLDAFTLSGRILGLLWALLFFLCPLTIAVAFGMFSYSAHLIQGLAPMPWWASSVIFVLFIAISSYYGCRSSLVLLRLRRLVVVRQKGQRVSGTI